MGVGDRRAAGKIRTVEDARRGARRRVPRVVFDYIDGGAETEGTMRANRTAFESVQFVPRMAATEGTPGPELSTTVLSTPLAMPVVLAPVGFTRVMHPQGDVAGARAAAAAGTVFTLSTMSGHPMDEVAAARGTGPPSWFQLYPLGGRQRADVLVGRAEAAGFTGLVVTVDTQYPGNRERDLRHGSGLPQHLDVRTAFRLAPRVAGHPRWLLDVVRDRFRLQIVNSRGLGTLERPLTPQEAIIEWMFAPLRWEDIAAIRRRWRGKMLVKGVLTAEDARRSVDCGADAVVVSNHGGRQLDGAPATMPALVEVVEACGGEVEVLVDGGIRRGSDVVRALALGARAVMVGRAWAYGLAAAGQPGVSAVLSVLRADIDRTLRLLGCPSVSALDRSFVRIPGDW